MRGLLSSHLVHVRQSRLALAFSSKSANPHEMLHITCAGQYRMRVTSLFYTLRVWRSSFLQVVASCQTSPFPLCRAVQDAGDDARAALGDRGAWGGEQARRSRLDGGKNPQHQPPAQTSYTHPTHPTTNNPTPHPHPAPSPLTLYAQRHTHTLDTGGLTPTRSLSEMPVSKVCPGSLTLSLAVAEVLVMVNIAGGRIV